MPDLQETLFEVVERLSAVETELRLMREQGTPSCAKHRAQTDSIETRTLRLEKAQGKQGLIAASLAAIGAGIVLALKFLVTGAKA